MYDISPVCDFCWLADLLVASHALFHFILSCVLNRAVRPGWRNILGSSCRRERWRIFTPWREQDSCSLAAGRRPDILAHPLCARTEEVSIRSLMRGWDGWVSQVCLYHDYIWHICVCMCMYVFGYVCGKTVSMKCAYQYVLKLVWGANSCTHALFSTCRSHLKAHASWYMGIGTGPGVAHCSHCHSKPSWQWLYM